MADDNLSLDDSLDPERVRWALPLQHDEVKKAIWEKDPALVPTGNSIRG
jgi:hypothetical protein